MNEFDRDPGGFVRKLRARRGLIEQDLSGGGQARRGDPQTAKDAARVNQAERRKQVISVLRKRDSTRGEIAERLGVKQRDRIGPRLGELQDIGLRNRPKETIRYWTIDGVRCGPLVKKRGDRRGTEGVYQLTEAGVVFADQPWRCGTTQSFSYSEATV